MPADDKRARLAAILKNSEARQTSFEHYMPYHLTTAADLIDAGWSDEHAAEVARLTERAEQAEARIAAAWDEGWGAAGRWQIAKLGTPYPWNPYRAALTDEQPAAMPESENQEEADLPNGHAPLDALSPFMARRIRTPEPPHLDPEPWACTRHGGGRHAVRDYCDRFEPRPADEHGRPYSQRIEDYEGGGRG